MIPDIIFRIIEDLPANWNLTDASVVIDGETMVAFPEPTFITIPNTKLDLR